VKCSMTSGSRRRSLDKRQTRFDPIREPLDSLDFCDGVNRSMTRKSFERLLKLNQPVDCLMDAIAEPAGDSFGDVPRRFQVSDANAGGPQCRVLRVTKSHPADQQCKKQHRGFNRLLANCYE